MLTVWYWDSYMLPLSLVLLLLWNYFRVRSGRVTEDLVSFHPPQLSPSSLYYIKDDKSKKTAQTTLVLTIKKLICYHGNQLDFIIHNNEITHTKSIEDSVNRPREHYGLSQFTVLVLC